MNFKKVSIILPVYNCEKYLEKCLYSIVNQTYKNLEIIIINDCSTDNSIAIINKYSKIDDRIKVYSNIKNMKLIYSLNKGIELSKGEYIARMDADDIAELDRIEKQVKFMEKNKNIMMSGTWIRYFGNINGKWKMPTKNDEIKAKLFFRTQFAHPSVIIRKEILDYGNIEYNKEYPNAEDWHMWIKISDKYDVANLSKTLLNYRKNDYSVSYINSQSQTKTCIKILKENFGKFNIDIEDNIAYALFNDDVKLLNENFKQVSKVLYELKERNEKLKKYDINIFNKVLNKKLFIAYCGDNMINFKDFIKFLNKYSICNSNTYILYFKLIIKLIIRR